MSLNIHVSICLIDVLQTIPPKDFAHDLHNSFQTDLLPEVRFISLFKQSSKAINLHVICLVITTELFMCDR